MENKSRAILMSVIYIITVISVLLGVFAIYNLCNVQKPWTLGTTYASKMNYSDDKTHIFKVKINSNVNKNGQAVYDLCMSSYNDVEGKSTSSFGIQCVGDWEIVHYHELANMFDFANFSNKLDTQNFKNVSETYAFGNFYFYKSDDNGKSYYYISDDKIPNELLIDIEGNFYKVSLNSYTYDEVYYKNGWDHLWGNESIRQRTVLFTWFDVFDSIIRSAAVDSAESEYSKFGLNFFDLSPYVVISSRDDNGQYHNLPATNENKNLFSIPVELSKDGAVDISDSLFNIVSSSTSWNYYNNTNAVEYWNAETVLTIDESQLNYVYYKSYDKYFLTIDKQYANYLRTQNGLKIKVVIDLSNKTKHEIAGIDLNNFVFDIDSFEIKNAGENFLVLNKDRCSVEPTIIKAV